MHPATGTAALDSATARDDATRVQPPADSELTITWPCLLVHAALTAALLNLALAPVGQFYLAWIALVPWLLAVWRVKTWRRAAAFGWISGLMFFGVAMPWLWHATWLGTALVTMYLAAFWAAAGVIIFFLSRYPERGQGEGSSVIEPDETVRRVAPTEAAGRSTPTGSAAEPSPGLKASASGPYPVVSIEGVLLIPAAWVAIEWVRSWLFSGFPWVPVSQTQSPLPVLCQISDLTGHYGVSFWVVSVNVLIALAFAALSGGGRACRRAAARPVPNDDPSSPSDDPSSPRDGSAGASPSTSVLIGFRTAMRRIIAPACIVAGMTAAIVGYGAWRMAQTTVTDGPTVMVLQPNFVHARGGAKQVSPEEQVAYHFSRTEAALRDRKVDLIVWSETVMPAMNPEARAMARADSIYGNRAHDDLLALSRRHGAAVLFGAYAMLKLDRTRPDAERNADIRNATYLYDARRADQPRYDKIHLVPYGESVPFRHSIPWLHDLMFKIAAYSVNYVITPGGGDALTVFEVPHGGGAWRFVTPICFEDIDGPLVARMLRPANPGGGGLKRADFIVNITNDGWFTGQMRAQHLQNAIFRSIENRVWTVRCSNTGISGFIDSCGRVIETIGSRTEGVAIRKIGIDPRLSLYTRWGDWFAWTCVLVAGAGILWTRAK